jgi:hypothetical protein
VNERSLVIEIRGRLVSAVLHGVVRSGGWVDVLPPIACHEGIRDSCSGFGVC